MRPLGRALAFALVAVCAAPSACTPPPPQVSLSPPIEATTVDVGDVFELRIVGEDKLPTTFTIAPDGSVDLPYIQRVKVAGLEPQEISALVRKRLIDEGILTDPSVSISIREYNSKRVEVLGEVQKPGSFSLQPGMTLLRVISLAGGFNTIANKDKITIRRKTARGTEAVTVSVEDIIANEVPDIPLQAGDSVNVAQRVF